MKHLPSGLLIVLATVSAVQAQHDYKKSRGLIRDGKYAEAITFLDARVKADPRDSEWVVQRAYAKLLTKQFAAGFEDLNKSLAMGVAPERYVGESRNLLAPLRDERPFADWLEKQTGDVVHGPMLGNLTANSASVWLRTRGARGGYVSAIPATGNALHRVEFETTADGDFATVVSLDKLVPSTTYRYEVTIQEGEQTRNGPRGSFRTPPANGRPLKFSFAFGGGAGYVPENERMWDTIAKVDPDALLLLGDNVYVDMPKHPAMQRFCYYRRHSVPGWRELVANRPVYTIWDDHDFGTNDCWGGPAIADPAWKPEVWDVFRQNWANPGYGGGRERPGCWYDFQVGDVHFVMLDGRYYRTNPRVKSPSMLGPEQLVWLKRTLKDSTATFTVIASPVPWEYATKGDSRDTWNGFRDERDTIFSFLTENRIDGVILISADRHRSDAWKIERPDAYPLYEFESSRLTNRHVHGTMKKALFSYNAKQSFGLVEFDTTADDPTVTYKVGTIDGNFVHELRLKHSELQHAAK